MAVRKIGRLSDVIALVGISRPTIDRLEAAGDFPQRIRLGRAAVGWDLDEIGEWLEKRPRGPKPVEPASAAA
jgi:predicted DNA-binding transcriptional regulator AlpA